MTKKKKKKAKINIHENSSLHKKAIAMTFEWIFAMLIGGIILFIAIYAVVNLLNTGQQQKYTESAAQLEGYLSPYETGLAFGVSKDITFPMQSKLLFEECKTGDKTHPFGVQSFTYSEKMFGKYSAKSNPISVYSKYIFTNQTVEGKEMFIVSVPFFMGYKVTDLILLYSGKYCLVGAPDEIKDTIDGLKLINIYFAENINDGNCSGTKVCFDNSDNGCDIKVSGDCNLGGACDSSYDYGSVIKYDKNNKPITVYYIGNLLYGAIFSDNKIYECNVKRLMFKFNELGNVYMDKVKIIETKGCSSNIQIPLNTAMGMASGMQSSQGLNEEFYKTIEEIQRRNQATSEACRLFINE